MTSSVYNYVNNAKVWLPMTAACHDPVNVRTLDKSGNGLHYRFGDGVTANTFPTKSTTRGYSFNGTTNYLGALANQTNAINEGTWAVLFSASNFALGTPHIISHYDGVGAVRCILQVFGTGIRYFVGDLVNPISLDIRINRSNVFAACYRTTDGNRRLYSNGLLAVPSSVGTNTIGIPITNPRLGMTYSGILPLAGNIFWYGHWEYALSELQLRDLEQRLRRQLNDV